MSELMDIRDHRVTIRRKLLISVSALALTVYVSSTGLARAEDTERPPLWIELGGQMESMQGTSSPFIAPFMTAITPTPGPYHDDIFSKGQEAPRFAFGGEGKISFQPQDSDWIFSAVIRYGRSRANKHIHQQSPALTSLSGGAQYMALFADTKATQSEHHAIVDFSAGKDVGLGRFGHDGTSTFSAGVRFAQLSAHSDVRASGRPSVYVFPRQFNRTQISFYNNTMWAHADRDFRGVGPSLSWKASAALVGNKHDGELTLDWGIDGAVLFGRQKAKTDHTTQAYLFPYTSFYHGQYQGYYYTRVYNHPHQDARSKRVTVPNIAAFAGVSWQTEHAKVSIGYRYDTFLNAMDTGIDVAKKSNVTFNGPFASISIGLGD